MTALHAPMPVGVSPNGQQHPRTWLFLSPPSQGAPALGSCSTILFSGRLLRALCLGFLLGARISVELACAVLCSVVSRAPTLGPGRLTWGCASNGAPTLGSWAQGAVRISESRAWLAAWPVALGWHSQKAQSSGPNPNPLLLYC